LQRVGLRLPPCPGPLGVPWLRNIILGTWIGRSCAVGSSRVTEDNLALDVRRSPGKTGVRMALSPGLLIRMRPLVQVQPGPLHHADLEKRSSVVSPYRGRSPESHRAAVAERIPARRPRGPPEVGA